jgi:hypothetical protein
VRPDRSPSAPPTAVPASRDSSSSRSDQSWTRCWLVASASPVMASCWLPWPVVTASKIFRATFSKKLSCAAGSWIDW